MLIVVVCGYRLTHAIHHHQHTLLSTHPLSHTHFGVPHMTYPTYAPTPLRPLIITFLIFPSLYNKTHHKAYTIFRVLSDRRTKAMLLLVALDVAKREQVVGGRNGKKVPDHEAGTERRRKGLEDVLWQYQVKIYKCHLRPFSC